MMREEFKKPLNKLKVKKGPQKKEIFQNGNSENMFTRKVTITLSTGKVLLSAEVTLWLNLSSGERLPKISRQ